MSAMLARTAAMPPSPHSDYGEKLLCTQNMDYQSRLYAYGVLCDCFARDISIGITRIHAYGNRACS